MKPLSRRLRALSAVHIALMLLAACSEKRPDVTPVPSPELDILKKIYLNDRLTGPSPFRDLFEDKDVDKAGYRKSAAIDGEEIID